MAKFSWQGDCVEFIVIVTTSELLCLEISLVVCILQGGNYINSLQTLSRTFLFIGGIAVVDLLLKKPGVKLLHYVRVTNRVKWTLWSIQSIVLLGVYGFVLFCSLLEMERGIAAPSFYRYFIVMFICTSVQLVSCLLTGLGADLGICVLALCHHSLYLLFLYITFLADFFKEEDFLLDNARYSEMKDAGFFDADWD